MLKMLKKHLILLIGFLVLDIFILIITTVKTNKVVYLPGVVSNVNNTVKIDGVNNSTNYYSTSVYYVDRVTLFQEFIYKKMNTATLYKKGKTPSYIESLQGEIEHNSAIYSSIISAYNMASKELDYEYIGTYVYNTNSKKINVGDVVLGSSYDECINNLNSDEIKILRNNKETTITLDEGDKVVLEYPFYKINDESIIVYDSTNEGPSAGFMQSLKLYDDLVEENLATNYKIAGTGTIDEVGHVGAIGCVDLKIYTAIYNKCDIFFIPEENRAEAEKALNKIDTDMVILYVDSLSDAINYLRGIE